MKKLMFPIMAILAAGCFTLKETPYPEMAMAALPEGREISIQLRGFKAMFTEYVPVYSYNTVWVDSYPRRYGWGGGHYGTVTSSAYYPQTTESGAFAQRAKTLAESAGFTTMAQQPDYIVEATFGGPFVTDGERCVEALWMLLSVFSADYSVQTWTAQLKIYDNKTGKLVFHHDYSQRYEVTVWGPFPLLSPAGSSKNTLNSMQSWCLTALTDRIMADAAAFLSPKDSRKSPPPRAVGT